MSAIGTAVAGGMLSATFIDLFYIPLLFVLISRLFRVEKRLAGKIEEKDTHGLQETN